MFIWGATRDMNPRAMFTRSKSTMTGNAIQSALEKIRAPISCKRQFWINSSMPEFKGMNL
jgi:hypothetical protein